MGYFVGDTVGRSIGTDDRILDTDALELGIIVELKLGTIEDLELEMDDGDGVGRVIGKKVGLSEGDMMGCSVCDIFGRWVGTDDGILDTDELELGIICV